MKRTPPSFYTLLVALVLLTTMAAGCKKKQAVASSSTSGTTTMRPASEPVEQVVQDVQTEATVLAIYERTPCYGQCPIFKLTIYTDGKAVYEGRNWVDMIGTFRTVVSKEQTDRLMAAAKEIDYFSLKEEYNNEMVTDLPSVVTQISNDGVLKRVRNRRGGPSSLKTLYNVFDAIVAESFWTKEETKD
jgi:hypothetical protein